MFSATDLPEPVVPAINRWGILARSAITGSPPMVLPSASVSGARDFSYSCGREQFAQIDGLALQVGQLDADDVAPGDDRDARGDRAHRARDVVGERDDARGFHARRRLEFIERHHRARPHRDDAPAHAEIRQHGFQHARILFQRVVGKAGAWAFCRRFGQKPQGRQLIFAVGEVERGLAVALGLDFLRIAVDHARRDLARSQWFGRGGQRRCLGGGARVLRRLNQLVVVLDSPSIPVSLSRCGHQVATRLAIEPAATAARPRQGRRPPCGRADSRGLKDQCPPISPNTTGTNTVSQPP